MSRTKNRNFLILLLLLCTLILVPAGRVQAAEEDALLGQIEEQVSAFLGSAYTLSDEGLDSLRGTSSFYEIFVDSWYEERDITGKYVELISTEAEEPSGGQIIVNSAVKFENYTADVVLYFDEAELRPVNYVMNIRYSMREKMTQAAQNMAVGLLVVFAVLVFLMFIIYLFRFLGPKKKESTKEAIPEVQKAAAVPGPIAEAEAVCSDAAAEEEIAAVIAAAIAAASEEAPTANGYVVRSVRRGNRSVWKRV